MTESISVGTPARGVETYRAAVADGHYHRDTGGLLGKHDNVRRYWEDQITRYALHGSIGPLVTHKRRSLSRIRVLDLGCGAGQGYEILTSLRKQGGSLAAREVDVLPSDMLGRYKGVDVNRAMVSQGNTTYTRTPKVGFEVADLRQGLGAVRRDPPYDVYFSLYGSLSHLEDDELRRLIEDITDHFDESCIFVADLIGRYSYEWPIHWPDAPDGEGEMRTYSMSYIYPPEVRNQVEVERFPLRLWCADELDRFVSEIVASKRIRVAQRKILDRSIFVGRHMDTGEFNEHATPVREAVNRLHEPNVRTELESLIVDYVPQGGFERLNAFFERFQVAWNAVVHAAIDALDHWADPEWLNAPPAEDFPDSVQDAIRTIRNVVRNIKWFRMGDPRANVVEPQLGYILRNLEMDLQPGLGVGHGLVAIYEFTRRT
ncbi:MAG: class I SAM-dependent methyltransferase [Planctomycetes bacterium]|nr:class I SAM-dependent methyltransferase [Planctomycetota bacterium]